MDLLLDLFLTQNVLESNNDSLLPYYEKERIVYPYAIFDYTDLSLYTEDEVPYEVRTKDGKAIDFELYWEYINNRNMLDGFTCTLQREE